MLHRDSSGAEPFEEPALRMLDTSEPASGDAKPVAPMLEANWTHVDRVTLPSSRPAFASMSLARKIEIWRASLTDPEAQLALEPTLHGGGIVRTRHATQRYR